MSSKKLMIGKEEQIIDDRRIREAALSLCGVLGASFVSEEMKIVDAVVSAYLKSDVDNYVRFELSGDGLSIRDTQTGKVAKFASSANARNALRTLNSGAENHEIFKWEDLKSRFTAVTLSSQPAIADSENIGKYAMFLDPVLRNTNLAVINIDHSLAGSMYWTDPPKNN